MADNVVGRPEFARILGVSERSITTYCQAGMPHTGGRKKGNPVQIETTSAIAWYVKFEANKKNANYASPTDTKVDYATELALEKQASRKLKELELDERTASVINGDHAKQVVWGAFNALIQNVLPVGRKIVPELQETQNAALAIDMFETALFSAMKAASQDIQVININANIDTPDT